MCKTILLSVLAACYTTHVAAQSLPSEPNHKAISLNGNPDDLIINEVQVANVDQTIDPSYNYGSWIELYNNGNTAISLEGFTLVHSDSDGYEESYTFGSGVGSVPAHGYKVVWFDHNSADGYFGNFADHQVRFKLDYDGGILSLYDSELSASAGEDPVATLIYDTAIPRCSYARTTDGGTEWAWTAEPTPGTSNESSHFAEMRLPAPVVSTDGSIFSSAVSFSVSIPDGTTLLYTTDGTTPVRSGATTRVSKDGAFNFRSTTVFRCALVADGYLPSPVVTRSFIQRKKDYYLPVISIVTDPRHLYDNEIGIYCTGTNGRTGNAPENNNPRRNWNMDWERPVNVEYLVPATDETSASAVAAAGYTTAFNIGSDMEICGGWSRADGGGSTMDRKWEMKSSFRLKTDKRYEGKNSFDYPIFPNNTHRKYKSLQVRNGGNDTKVRTKDVAVQIPFVTSGLYIDAQDTQPAHIFFNGQFLGTFNIRESNNKAYGYSGYGISGNNIDAFEIHGEAPNYEQKAGDDEALMRWVDLAQLLADNADESTGFAESNETNDAIWAEILKLVDITEYANYFAAELYIGSSDWLNNSNNCKGFRDRRDGKFHFTMFDVDFAFDYTSGCFTAMMDGECKTLISDLFRNMMKYRPFMRQLIDAYAVISGSALKEDLLRSSINAYTALTAKAIAFEGYSGINTNSTNSKGQEVINAYVNNKTNRINVVKNYYGLTTYNVNVSANIPDARILVNNLEMPLSYFDGMLYAPATLTALAPAGYTFTGWRLEGYNNDKNLQTLIPTLDTWAYYDKGSADGTGWKGLDFTGTWNNAKAPFGNGNGNFTYSTKLDNGNLFYKRPTYYFRHEFNLDDDPTTNDVYQITYQVDDGCVIYVNGHAVGSHLMASTNPSYSDYATGTDSKAPYQETISVPYSVFQKGRNILAVEVHNYNELITNDVFFDASLTYTLANDAEPEPTDILSRCQNLQLAELPDGSAQKYILTATYRRAKGVDVPPVRVNEVSPANGIFVDHDNWKRNDWVELYNTTDEPIDVAGYFLSDKAGKPTKWAIPAKGTQGSAAETVIPPHGTLIIWCDKLTGSKELHAPFKLGNDDGSIITLQAPDGSWIDTLNYNRDSSQGTASYGRYPDGSNNVYYMERATIGKRNSMVFGKMDIEALAYDYATDVKPYSVGDLTRTIDAALHGNASLEDVLHIVESILDTNGL